MNWFSILSLFLHLLAQFSLKRFGNSQGSCRHLHSEGRHIWKPVHIYLCLVEFYTERKIWSKPSGNEDFQTKLAYRDPVSKIRSTEWKCSHDSQSKTKQYWLHPQISPASNPSRAIANQMVKKLSQACSHLQQSNVSLHVSGHGEHQPPFYNPHQSDYTYQVWWSWNEGIFLFLLVLLYSFWFFLSFFRYCCFFFFFLVWFFGYLLDMFFLLVFNAIDLTIFCLFIGYVLCTRRINTKPFAGFTNGPHAGRDAPRQFQAVRKNLKAATGARQARGGTQAPQIPTGKLFAVPLQVSTLSCSLHPIIFNQLCLPLLFTWQPYLHLSRHKHARSRARGEGGRFQSKRGSDDDTPLSPAPAQAGSLWVAGCWYRPGCRE